MVDAFRLTRKLAKQESYNSAVSPPSEDVYANANWLAPIRHSSIIAAFDKVILVKVRKPTYQSLNL